MATTLSPADRAWLLDMAFRCHAPTMLEPFAPYRRLRDLLAFVRDHDGHGMSYLSGTFYSDLATWYLLAWSGESLRRGGHTVPLLMAKGGNFSANERQALLAELGAAVADLIPRYRKLADSGQIELSCTPAKHPLAPLLLDFRSAREALPDCALPAAPEYPGRPLARRRTSDSRPRQPQPALRHAPAGLWPAEGALSTAFLQQIADAGFAWTASSHGVLRHSAGDDGTTTTPWLPPEGTTGDILLFFRNERLSDLIGFEYAKWHGRDAAQHFMTELKAIHLQDDDNLIPVFLDGENAWEYYPYNAWYFFSDLYDALARNPAIRTVTLSEAAARHRARSPRLPRLTAGSWVYGTLSTWIGHADKNRAWEMLCDAKQCADRALDSGRLDAAACAKSSAAWPSAKAPTGSGGWAITTRRNRSPVSTGCSARISNPSTACSACQHRPASTTRSARAAAHRKAAAPCAAPTRNDPTMTRPVTLLLGVHAHQPVGNFPGSHRGCAPALLQAISRNPARLSGLPFRRPLFRLAARLAARTPPGRHGTAGGHGPPRPGRTVQLRRHRAGAGRHPAARPGRPVAVAQRQAGRWTGIRPSGAWLTERVWDSSVVPRWPKPASATSPSTTTISSAPARRRPNWMASSAPRKAAPVSTSSPSPKPCAIACPSRRRTK
jgi:hypothetical protein